MLRDWALNLELQVSRPLEIRSSDSPSLVGRWLNRDCTQLDNCPEVPVAIVTLKSYCRRNVITGRIENERQRIK